MRLLNRTTLHYLIYSVAVLLIGTPVFYFTINRLFTKDVDETLQIQKKEIQHRISKMKSEDDLRLWADLDGDVKIEPTSNQVRDTIYTTVMFDSLSNEMEPYRVLSSTVFLGDKKYHLTARVSMVESEDLIIAIVTTQASVLILLFSGLLVINWWVSKRIWKPFYDTLEKLRNFEVEKTPLLKLSSSSIKEFRDLNTSIEQLAERNYSAYLSQKEFTENAAHEMQTPLAVFQSKLELLMQTKGLTEEQANLMVSLISSTGRLTKLNKGLLLLSKIENNQFIDLEAVDIALLTTRLIEIFEDQAETKNIRIQFEAENDLLVRFNPILIDILLSNLISNALKHNSKGGVVTISITDKKWRISNTGEQAILSPSKIYDRFQKGDANQESTGLGLAIVKKICDVSKTDIQYGFDNHLHFFTLTF